MGARKRRRGKRRIADEAAHVSPEARRRRALLRASAGRELMRGRPGYVAPEDQSADAAEMLRLQLIRAANTLLGAPRRCRDRRCRRARRCVGPAMLCERDMPQAALTPRQEAAVRVKLRRAIDRRMAALAREAAEEERKAGTTHSVHLSPPAGKTEATHSVHLSPLAGRGRTAKRSG